MHEIEAGHTKLATFTGFLLEKYLIWFDSKCMLQTALISGWLMLMLVALSYGQHVYTTTTTTGSPGPQWQMQDLMDQQRETHALLEDTHDTITSRLCKLTLLYVFLKVVKRFRLLLHDQQQARYRFTNWR